MDESTSNNQDEIRRPQRLNFPHRSAYLPSTASSYLKDFVVRALSFFRFGRILTLTSFLRFNHYGPIEMNMSLSPRLSSAKKIAVFAHFSSQVHISKSDQFYISQLREAGFSVIVSSTCTSNANDHQLLWSQWEEDIDGLITRPNFGFDFASWSVALKSTVLNDPNLHPSQIILVNNSMYGPLFPLAPILDELAGRGDIFGFTASREFSPHLQSYFLGFNQKTIESPEFRTFWTRRFGGVSKWSTIFRLELTWERFFVRRGFVSAVFVEDTRNFYRNPLTFLWKDLVSAGFPLVKKSLFTYNYDSIDVSDWKSFLSNKCPEFDQGLISNDILG